MTVRHIGAGARSLTSELNRLASRERRWQRKGLEPAEPATRMLGGHIKTVRPPRPATGAEATEP